MVSTVPSSRFQIFTVLRSELSTRRSVPCGRREHKTGNSEVLRMDSSRRLCGKAWLRLYIFAADCC